MVNFRRLTDRAKDVVDKRGGTDALKDDMQELRNIAKGKGSLKEKAAAAKDAMKDPGRRGTERQGDRPAQAATPAATTTPAEQPGGGAPDEKPPAPTGGTAGPDTPESPRTK